MRRKLAFLLGLFAGLAVFGLLRRRSQAGVAGVAAPGGHAGAQALRRKLAESRTDGDARPGAPAPPAAEGPDAELDRARAAVHRDAHVTLDEMRRAGL